MSQTSSSGGSVSWSLGPPEIPPATAGIAVAVNAKGNLVLRPTDALGAYFLNHFAHGDLRARWVHTMRADSNERPSGDCPQETLKHIEISATHRPLLSKGGDPFYTGLGLDDAEQQACRDLVDKMRAEKKAPPKPAKKPRGKGKKS